MKKAKDFEPFLSEYILATSGPRSAHTQQLARQISEQHRKEGLFSVHVYGWEDIVDRLSDFSDLYSAYLRELRLVDLKIGGQRLPRTTGHLYGREAELQSLTEAWDKDGQNVLSIVAWGGVGKTALVKHWLGQMALEKFRGAERVFTWSFYSQGAKDQPASTDLFIDQALRFFEDPDPAQGGPYEKGERLAGLVTLFKTLLVLDGLEPLQYPSGPLEGQLKDPAVQILIDRLSLSNKGLCLITTRERASDIAHLEETTAPAIALEHLSSKAGAVLLHQLGVRGTVEEVQEASQAFAGHALALSLLGTYLAEVHNGDVRHWKEVPLLDEGAPQGGHARRVMQSYQKWLGEGSEWSLLQLMGFFDRPAKGAEVGALLAEPPIECLTDAILKLDQPARKRALSHLRRLRLLAESPPEDPDGMDAHPLLREYLAQQLQQHHPDSCREGHRRLYQHLKQTVKELPDTLEEMMPLYQAVAHGCRGGLHQEVYDSVYRKRIRRDAEYFNVRKLGAFGTDLGAVASFFEELWKRPAPALGQSTQSMLLSIAGFVLRALGRLSEAAEPMRAALEAAKSSKDWKNAAQAAGNLSEIHLTLGDLPQAVDDARHSVELADRSGDAGMRTVRHTTLADALHQSGDLAQARSLFQKAERIQKEEWPQYPLLFSLRGFHYADLLLGECEPPAWNPQASPAPARQEALSRCRQVRERAESLFEFRKLPQWKPAMDSMLDIALDHLTLGRAFLLEAVLDAPSPDLLSPAQHHLDRAVTGLRESGNQDEVPRGLIARAQLRRVQFQHSGDEPFAQQAQQDLDEASQIASRCPMPLFQADIHLEQSRLHHAQGHLDQARQSLSKARELIQKHGYHRRDSELEAMEKALV
ncbi:MAG: hypothetical protein V3T83_12740 [Acidobacteriota bacterium]